MIKGEEEHFKKGWLKEQLDEDHVRYEIMMFATGYGSTHEQRKKVLDFIRSFE